MVESLIVTLLLVLLVTIATACGRNQPERAAAESAAPATAEPPTERPATLMPTSMLTAPLTPIATPPPQVNHLKTAREILTMAMKQFTSAKMLRMQAGIPASGMLPEILMLPGTRALDQIHTFVTVQLLAKTPDGFRYKMTDQRNVIGWVRSTLLTIDSAVATKVSVATQSG